MKSSDLGNSVDEVEQLIRKHEAFEKLLASQDEKVQKSKTNIQQTHELHIKLLTGVICLICLTQKENGEA